MNEHAVVIAGGGPTGLMLASEDRVHMVEAEGAGTWELPVLGEVPAPPAVLIRPDGHVAWVGAATDPGLVDALSTWFGAPTAGLS